MKTPAWTLGVALVAAQIALPAWADNALLDPAFWTGADLAKVQAAVDAGANPTEVTEAKVSPLYLALETGVAFDVVQYLVDQGADVTLYGHDASPLMLAARSCSVPCVEYLIAKGADLTQVDDSWRDALNWGAGRQADPKVFEALIAHGADPDSMDINGRTPAFTAARMNGALAATQYLASVSDIQVIDVNGNSALMWAALRNDNPEVVRFVYDLMPDPMLKNEDGRDALILSAIRPRKTTAIPEFLLSKGYDVNAAGTDGRTALSLAAESNTVAAVQVYLDAGALVTSTDANGKTPLHHAAASNTPEVVALLLSAGAEVNAKDAAGATPLALAQGRSEIATLLTDAGAM